MELVMPQSGADRAPSAARCEIALAQEGRTLNATHSVFRYGHVLHRPAAVPS